MCAITDPIQCVNALCIQCTIHSIRGDGESGLEKYYYDYIVMKLIIDFIQGMDIKEPFMVDIRANTHSKCVSILLIFSIYTLSVQFYTMNCVII